MRVQESALDTDFRTHDIYLAGQKVPPGTYRLIEGDREIRLDQEGLLPATCDGHVAAYLRRLETWGERKRQAEG